MRRIFAWVTLAASVLSILAVAAILRLWFVRGRASAFYAANLSSLYAALVLLPLILVWLVVRRRTSLERSAFESMVISLVLLLALTGALGVADSFVRFEIVDEGKIPLQEVVISGRGGTGRVQGVPPGGRLSVPLACRGWLAKGAGEVRIRYRIGDQIRTRIAYSARQEITGDKVEIRIDESGARRSPGGWLFPPPGEP
ncbi:MAG TPA: hypothetical protein VGS07_01190 [Thermoanaerobaculia bacterium]|nr:hypothetical protein [Thermoanaerobaculia bacterium]